MSVTKSELKKHEGVVSSVEPIMNNGQQTVDNYGNKKFVVKFQDGFQANKSYKGNPKIQVGPEVVWYEVISAEDGSWSFNAIKKVKSEEEAKAAYEASKQGWSQDGYIGQHGELSTNQISNTNTNQNTPTLNKTNWDPRKDLLQSSIYIHNGVLASVATAEQGKGVDALISGYNKLLEIHINGIANTYERFTNKKV